MGIKVKVELKCDGCQKQISLDGRVEQGRRGNYTYIDDIYTLRTGDCNNTLSIEKSGEVSWLAENKSSIDIACSHSCVAKLLPKWLKKLDKEFSVE